MFSSVSVFVSIQLLLRQYVETVYGAGTVAGSRAVCSPPRRLTNLLSVPLPALLIPHAVAFIMERYRNSRRRRSAELCSTPPD